MTRVWKISLPFIILAMASALAFVMFAVRPEAQHTPVPPPTLLVNVASIETRPVTHIVRSQGTVAPRTQTTLVAEAQGQIIEVSPSFVAGGFFRKHGHHAYAKET